MTQERRFRFSVQAAQARDAREWQDLARTVEDLGYAALYTADHLADCLTPLSPLVAAADATTTLRVGVLVLNNDLRHPAVLAREAATIDLLTDGRLELGLGAGHSFPEYQRIGLAFDPARVRVERLEESVRTLRALLDGETVSFEGTHYRLEGEACQPRPVQSPVPLLVGGGGRRVLSIAARLADAVGMTGLGATGPDGDHHEPSRFAAAAVDEQVRWVRAQAAERWEDIELHALVQAVVPTAKRATAAEDIARHMPALAPEDVLTTPYLLVGNTADMVEQLLAQRERWGFSHYTVRVDALEDAAPLVEALAGT